MELVYENNTLHIDSEKKRISLTPSGVILDQMPIEMAGEYEKGGFLCYVREQSGTLITQIRIEGYNCVTLPCPMIDLTPENLEWLGTVDILFLRADISSLPMIEKIEPRAVVVSGDGVVSLSTHLAITEEPMSKRKIRAEDLPLDKTAYICMG